MHRILAALLLLFAAVAQVAAAPVTVNSSAVYNLAYNGSVGDSDLDGSTLYGTRTLTSAAGGSSSTTYINWLDTGSGALFDFDFEQVRTGALNSYAVTQETTLIFTVNTNTTYSLSGMYSVTGPANYIFSKVQLLDYPTSQTIFDDASYSLNTANEIFNLGVPGDGDSYNVTFGSLTGTLIAGTMYKFYFLNGIQANTPDGGASATGCVTLSIGGATGGGTCGVPSVPLPAAAWLLLSGLGGLGALGRRRKA